MFATKPELAGELLKQAHDRGISASFVAGDEVYGCLDLRRSIRGLRSGYVMAVRSNHMVTLPSGRRLTVKTARNLVRPSMWQRMRTGSATKGAKDYHWAMIEITPDDTPGGHDDELTLPSRSRPRRESGASRDYRSRARAVAARAHGKAARPAGQGAVRRMQQRWMNDMDQALGILAPQLVRASTSASPRASSIAAAALAAHPTWDPGIVTATFLLRLVRSVFEAIWPSRQLRPSGQVPRSYRPIPQSARRAGCCHPPSRDEAVRRAASPPQHR